jgi:S1-C subfamily serine protease
MYDQFFMDFFGAHKARGVQKKQSLGSGVIVDPLGYILTNYHVVQRADRIWVTLADGQEHDAKLVAGDEVNDLALIKVEVPGLLPQISMARDDDLLLGETVIVLGNPYGLGHTVTVGVLSAKNREASFEGEVIYRDILQTDAAVNPGSSGGPMMNVDGQLIGISVAIHQEAENIGFAIPVKRVRSLIKEWFEPSRLQKIWLGMELLEGSDGVFIGEVKEKGPAAAAGVLPGVEVISVNGTVVHTLLDAYKAMVGTGVGDPVDLELSVAGGASWLRITAAPLLKLDGYAQAQNRLGLQFAENSSLTNNLNYKGLIIHEVEEGSPAEQAGIRPGLFLSRINQLDVNNESDIALALSRIQKDDWAELDVVAVEVRSSMLLARTTRLRLKLK